eukprot:2150363-Lingulodinium_polyedra.AAC.1
MASALGLPYLWNGHGIAAIGKVRRLPGLSRSTSLGSPIATDACTVSNRCPVFLHTSIKKPWRISRLNSTLPEALN